MSEFEKAAGFEPEPGSAGALSAGGGDSPYAAPKSQVVHEAAGPEPAAAPKTALHRVGQLLCLGGVFIVPAVLGMSERISGRTTGMLVGGGLANWLLFGGLAWLVTRKLSPRAKGIGALIAGLMVLGSVLATGAEKAAERKYLDMAAGEMREALEDLRLADQGATELPKHAPLPEVPQSARRGRVAFFCNAAAEARYNAATTVALNRKVAALDLVNLLAPERITSVAGIKRSRETMVTYRAVLAERTAKMQASAERGLRLIVESELPEIERVNAKKTFEEKTAADAAAVAELERSSTASANHVDAALDFAQRSLGRITNRNGRLVFRDQVLLDEYRRLIDIVSKSADAEEAAFRKVQEAIARRRSGAADALARINN